QERICLPVAARHAHRVEADFLLQGPARGLEESALELVREAIGVDDLAGVCRDPGAEQPDRAGRAVDLELDHHRGVALRVLVAGEGESLTSAVDGGPSPAGAP